MRKIDGLAKDETLACVAGACSQRGQGLFPSELLCPFFASSKKLCLLMRKGDKPTDKRQAMCCSDDFDACPTYMGYMLRRSKPLRSDCDWHDAV